MLKQSFVHSAFWRLMFLFGSLTTAASGLAQSQQQFALTPGPDVVPSSYFSMNLLFHPKNKVPWPSIPLGGWRTSHADWADLQPQRDQWYFDLLDKYVSWSDQHQLPILMLLTYTPKWASSKPDAVTDTPEKAGISAPPSDINDWRNFVRTVATRYKGHIRMWEIWNEPNRDKSWVGSPQQLVGMAKEAYTILKQIDPGCTIVSPAPTRRHGLDFFKAYLAAGGGKYADVIGYHFYVDDDPPEAMVPLILDVRKIMNQYGQGDKQLWDTEAGWLSTNKLPQDIAADYVARAEILNWAAGVQRFFWFAWEAQGLKIALVQKDNATLTPAGQAFATVEKWLTGRQVTHCESHADGTWYCELHDNSAPKYIVWNGYHPSTFNISKDWKVSSVQSLSGNQYPLAGKAIQIGPEPVLLQ